MSTASDLAAPRAVEGTGCTPDVLGASAVIAHDWLVAYGGSERVVEEIRLVLPNSRLVTALCENRGLPAGLDDAATTFLQRVPGATRHHEWLLPLMPLAWRAVGIVNADVVISSSHACAKAIRVAPGVPHLCYCHTPMRYAWDFQGEATRFPLGLRTAARASMFGFREWDRRKATGVTEFIANSTAVAQRILHFYGRPSRIIHPPVRTDFFTPGAGREDFFLYVGRLTGYKRPDLVVRAFDDLPYRLIVVGDGRGRASLEAEAAPNVSFLGSVDEEVLRKLYRSARALVSPVNEDFGIAMAEAQACGTPVIGLASGGALDIVDDGETGWLVQEQTVRAIRQAVRRAAEVDLDCGAIAARAARFSTARFRREMSASVEEALRAQR